MGPQSARGDDALAKAAHRAYHTATKDWVAIPSWNDPNCLKEGWRAAARAVLETYGAQAENND